MKNIPHPNLKDAAIAFQRACDKSSLPNLHLLPYSRFRDEHSTLWWLCKEKGRTAFDQGKIVLGEPERIGRDTGMFVGLHIERGMKQGRGNDDWVLKRTWKWHSFVADMFAGLPAAVEKAAKIIEQPLEVYVFANLEKSTERVKFSSTGRSLDSPSHSPAKLDALAGVLTSATWPDLGDALNKLPRSVDWHWIDIMIVVPVECDPAASDESAECIQMLECLEPYLGRN